MWLRYIETLRNGTFSLKEPGGLTFDQDSLPFLPQILGTQGGDGKP